MRCTSELNAPRRLRGSCCVAAGKLGQVSPELQAAFQTAESPNAISALAESFCAAVEDGSYAAKGWPKSMYVALFVFLLMGALF